MEDLTLEQTVEELGIIEVSTTSEMSGYPRNILQAYSCFDNFKQLKEFAEKFDLTIIGLVRRAGQDLWTRGGQHSEPFTLDAETFGDDYRCIPKMDFEDFRDEEILPCIEDIDNLEDFNKILAEKLAIYTEVNELEDNEQVLTVDGILAEVIAINTISYEEDSKYYELVAIKL